MDQRTDPPPPSSAASSGNPGLLIAIAQCVRFYSRLPAPRLPGESDPYGPIDLATLPRALPFAAVIIAAPACLALWIGDALGLPALLIAALTIAVSMIASGAFHEDGLADIADGFGGGATIPRKLEIMKDSRVGTFGASAVCFSILIRVAAVSTLLETRPLTTVIALVCAIAALSRIAGLTPLMLLPTARSDGASATLGRPSPGNFAIGFLIAAALTGALSAITDWPMGLGVAIIVGAAAAGLAVSYLSARQIQGQTGDVAGAAQQIAEMICLIIPLTWIFAR